MAETTKFITTADFADYTDISAYIAAAYVNRYILEAQQHFIKPVLGNTLYTALQTAVAGSTETAADTALLAKIKPVLVYRSTQLYLPFSGLTASNMGIRQFTEENSVPASNEELQRIANRAKINANMFEALLWDFLDTNKDTYTTWRDATDRLCKRGGITGLTSVAAPDIKTRKRRVYDTDF